MLKTHILLAAALGLALGAAGELFFAFLDRVPVLGCLFGPVALAFDLALPVLIGAIASAWGARRGWMKTPSGVLDGAAAATLAELASRLFGLCASLSAARGFFFGPRLLLPSVGPAAQAVFSGVWSLGWLVVSLALAALLGALGGLIYGARSRT